MSADETEIKLNNFIAAVSFAQPLLSELHGLPLESMDLQRALSEVFDAESEDSYEVLERNLTGSEMVEALRSFDFKKFHPDILAEIVLEESIIPDGIPRRLDEQTIKVKGEVWRIHKNDADPWPSKPHAHNYQEGLVLHLGTGELFDRNRLSVGKIGTKKLRAIRERLRGISLPKLEE